MNFFIEFNKKEIVEVVIIFEILLMMIVGVVGYIEIFKGLRVFKIIFVEYFSEDCRRRFYKNWYKVFLIFCNLLILFEKFCRLISLSFRKENIFNICNEVFDIFEKMYEMFIGIDFGF